MSKQSEAKTAQGYTKHVKNCSNCKNFTSKKNIVYGYIGESNLRCSLGNFAVNKTAICDKYEAKS